MSVRGGAITASELTGAGLADHDIARLVRRGQLVRVERGRYVQSPAVGARPSGSVRDFWVAGRRDHLTRLAAALAVSPLAVAALRSAALVWDLPVSSIPPRPEVLRPRNTSRLVGVRTLRSATPPPIVVHEGLAVTTLERTAVDIALDLPEPQALVTVDAALARGADRDLMGVMLETRGSVRGCVRARRTLTWSDACSESALESRGRGELLVRGVPRPHCNPVIRLEGVEFRPDDLWLPLGIVGEADGRLKYEEGPQSGPRSEDRTGALYAEKRRQEWLETVAGLHVVRWSDAEVRYDADGLMHRWRMRVQQREREPWCPPPGLVVLGRERDGRVVRSTQIWPPQAA